MTPKRKGIGKRLRFEIFARDRFTCRYCGSQSDAVPLVIDHMIPVAKGGTNDPDNLITACQPCNQGKAAKLIEQSAPNEEDRLRLAQERNEQMSAAKHAKEAMEARNALRDELLDFWLDSFEVKTMLKTTLSTIYNMVQQHGIHEVLEWITIAAGKGLSEYNAIRYICGIRRKVYPREED